MAETLGLLKQLVLGAGSVETICCFKSLHWETDISTHLNDFLAAKCFKLKKNEAGEVTGASERKITQPG